MKRLACSMLALAFAAASMPAYAQSGLEAMSAAAERLQAAQTQGEADAIRPGDDDLGCEQLEAEIASISTSPEMQAFTTESGDYAQGQQERMNEARNRAVGQAGMGMVMGFASSFIPGLGMAQGLAMQAQMSAMQAQGERDQLEAAARIDRMTPVMPMMMRGQRVYDLAQARECAFTQEQPPAPEE